MKGEEEKRLMLLIEVEQEETGSRGRIRSEPRRCPQTGAPSKQDRAHIQQNKLSDDNPTSLL